MDSFLRWNCCWACVSLVLPGLGPSGSLNLFGDVPHTTHHFTQSHTSKSHTGTPVSAQSHATITQTPHSLTAQSSPTITLHSLTYHNRTHSVVTGQIHTPQPQTTSAITPHPLQRHPRIIHTHDLTPLSHTQHYHTPHNHRHPQPHSTVSQATITEDTHMYTHQSIIITYSRKENMSQKDFFKHCRMCHIKFVCSLAR